MEAAARDLREKPVAVFFSWLFNLFRNFVAVPGFFSWFLTIEHYETHHCIFRASISHSLLASRARAQNIRLRFAGIDSLIYGSEIHQP